MVARARRDPAGIAIHHRDRSAGDPGEDGRPQADGAGAHHQHPRAFAHSGTADRMGADGEKLHRRRRVQGQTLCGKEIALRQAQPFAHPAVAMHAENRDGHAAVRLALAAGDAAAAGKIGIDRHHLVFAQPARRRCLGHHAGKLMSHDPGIVDEGVQPLEDMIVGAAGPDPPDLQQHLVGATAGLCPLIHGERAGLRADEGCHAGHRICPPEPEECRRVWRRAYDGRGSRLAFPSAQKHRGPVALATSPCRLVEPSGIEPLTSTMPL